MARRSLVKVLALLLSTALLVSCNPFGLRDLLEAATRSALSIDPTNVSMPAGSTLTFSADGGVPPYTYTTTSGSIDAATGEYTGPLSAGSATITVTDFAGATADAGVTITELVTGLALSPSSITVSVNTSLTFAGIGGTGPYTYSFQSTGSGSPDINPATGYYVAGSIGATADVVRVTDALAATATATVTVVALASAVDYSVSSTAGLPASGVAGAAIPGGLTFRVLNAGPGDGAMSVDWSVYLSANAVLDGGDIVVDEGTAPALDDDEWVDVALSGTYPTGPTGAGFLIVTVDSADDTSPGNNTSAPKAFTLQPRPVDYHVPMVNHTGGSTTGLAVNGTFTVENQLAAAGSSNFSWYVYASVDTSVDGGDYLLQWGSHLPLAGGGSDVILISGNWPTTAALYRLLVRVYAADDTVGTNDTGWTSQVDVQGALPPDIDYQAAAPVNTGGTVAGGAMNGTFQLTNTGSFAGSQTVYWTVYRSDDALLEVGTDPIAAMGSHAALGAGASTPVGYLGTWPAGTDTYFLFVEVSAIDDVDTSDNDSTGTPVGVTAPNVDYVVQAFSEISGAVAGDPINGTLQIRNSGTSAGSQPVFWTVYLSEDATLIPAGDLVVDAGSLAALGAGGTSLVTGFGGTWPVSPYPPWTWRLYLVVDAADEVDPLDNTSSPLPRTTSAPNADYDVTAVSNTGGTAAGHALAGTFNATNLGPHHGTQAIPWRVYLSTNAVYDAGVDTLADSGVIGSPGLTVGSFTGPVAFDGTWPTAAGGWYLVVVLDAGDDGNTVNNEAASGLITTTAPNVNYDVLTVTNTGGTTAGGPLAGNFTVRNIGTFSGSRTVYWIAYRSDDLVLTPGTDPVVDSGSTAAILAGATSAAIPFTGAWPSALVTKTYYLFVRVFAADDVLATDDTGDSGIVTVNPPNINYDVIVVNNTGPLVAGGALAGTFQVQNIGSVNGSATLYWAVYRSLDLVYTVGVDPVIDSGSIPGGLTAGNSANPGFTGTWPDSTMPVNYYYFVRVLAADDIASANDDQFSGMLTVAAGAPDYRIINQAVNGTGTPGAALTGTNQFQIQNASANPGAKTITWRAYASLDEILDGSDTLLAMNTTAPLAGSATSAVIPHGGTWPAFGSYYRIIVSVDADDDTNPANDTQASGEVAVPVSYVEGGENNNDNTSPFTQVSDYGITILPYQLVRITGVMDPAYLYDNFRWTAGAGMTRIEMKITWSTGDDDMDLYFWTTLGTEFSSDDTAADKEPDSNRFVIISLTPGNDYYTAAYAWLENNTSGNAGQPYQMFLYGKP